MGCDELRHLLNTDWRGSDGSSRLIATHIRSCRGCSHGIERLTKALIENDPLSCSQSRSRFPAYYEATRSEYPLVKMSDVELAEMAVHFGHCAACREQYEVFAMLCEMEEEDEIV